MKTIQPAMVYMKTRLMNRYLVVFLGIQRTKMPVNRTALHRFKTYLNTTNTKIYLQEKIQVSTGKGYRLSVDFEF